MAAPADYNPLSVLSRVVESSGVSLLNSELVRAKRAKPRPHLKRPIGSSCQRCRQRKVRCDGESPCGFCSARDGICIYGTTDIIPSARKRAPRIPKPAITSNNDLLNSFRRMYYLDMYALHVHQHCPVIQLNLSNICRANITYHRVSDQLQETAALCISSRALGHTDLSVGLFSQARILAAQVQGENTLGAAAGIFLMAMYQLGEDHGEAKAYLNSASQMALCGTLDETRPMRRMIDRFLMQDESVQRVFRSQRSITDNPFIVCVAEMNGEQRFEDELDSLFKHPLIVTMITTVTRWPVHCGVMDLFCESRNVPRAPLEHRTNATLPAAQTELMLRCLEIGEMSVRSNASNGVLAPDEPEVSKIRLHNRYRIALGLRVVTCSIGGLVRLGCYYAQRGLEALQMLPTAAGFYRHHLLPLICGLVGFVAIYKENLALGGLNYRSFMMEICDTLRPLSQFKFIRDLIEIGEQRITDTATPALPPAPHDEAMAAEWMDPARDPIDPETYLCLVRRTNPTAAMKLSTFSSSTPSRLDISSTSSGLSRPPSATDVTATMSDFATYGHSDRMYSPPMHAAGYAGYDHTGTPASGDWLAPGSPMEDVSTGGSASGEGASTNPWVREVDAFWDTLRRNSEGSKDYTLYTV